MCTTLGFHSTAVMGASTLAVLAPGTVVGRGTLVYGGASLRGVVPAGAIVKVRTVLEVVERREVEPEG